jgi:hypothetical protein
MTDALATCPESAIVHQSSPLEVNDVLAVVRRVGIIMREVMIEGTHYGLVPGCGDKPCLLKPGAEKLSMTFRLLPRYEVTMTDLGNGHREYSIVCILEGPDGDFRGQGIGSCSTLEKKYRYRKSGNERVENPDLADVYNTCLKQGKKRAHVDAVITATACSDMFKQDIEDMPDDVRESVVGNDKTSRPPLSQPASKPADAPASNADGKPIISDAQRKRFYAIAKGAGKTDDQIKQQCLAYGFNHSADITRDKYEELVAWAEAK